jgi:hypothetical protein
VWDDDAPDAELPFVWKHKGDIELAIEDLVDGLDDPP